MSSSATKMPPFGISRDSSTTPRRLRNNRCPMSLHVGRPFSKIAIRHPAESADVLVDRELQRGLGGESVVDEAANLVEEALVLEHHAVGIEEAAVDLGN